MRFRACLILILVGGCAAGEGLGMPDASRRSDAGVDAATGPIDGGGSTPEDAGAGSDASTDAGTDAGPVELVGLCEACSIDAQCGSLARCGPLSGGEAVCLRLCDPEFNDCPRGFDCASYAPLDFENVCLPVGERCCIDEDADGFGVGGQCMGPDCDDADIDRNPGAPEVCDNADQDCDDRVDEAFTDCEEAGCFAGSAGTYQEAPAEGCADGACAPAEATSCGDYACEEGGTEGERCATECAPAGSDDDGFCAVPAHCDDGFCAPDFDDGEVCDEDSDCVSGNCENGYCCGMGLTCCNADTDCPGYPGEGTVCSTPTECQGTRGVVSCDPSTFSCVTESGIDDDSACGTDITANACGTFADVVCSGEVDQPRPTCASACTADEDCDPTAHCDFSFCFPDLPDGQPCDEPSDCISGHCQNGFCCMGGDCCRDAASCPSGYGADATCDEPRACAGTRDVATCRESVCGTDADVTDDSACTSAIVADDCGLYPSIRCTGSVDQTTPSCATSCSGDSECDESAHCDASVCELDRANGQACDEASDCISGYCANGFCCAGGDCCATAMDCPSTTYSTPSECISTATCQGSRRDPVCTPSFTCQLGGLVDDDSGCFGIESNACGLYPAVECTSGGDQTSDQAIRCATACTSDGDCDSGAFCNASGECQSEGGPGDACRSSSECAEGRNCVDGVCCETSCTGLCEACNVPGALGTCSPIPSGEDPAGECGRVSCDGYYFGFAGDVCYERADAPARDVSCNGARACEGASLVCPDQGIGPIAVTCDATCQSPLSGSCTGTAAPVCENLDPGDITCGRGACERTVAECVSGSPNTCEPGAESDETCNNIDDDCDGVADNNITGASVEAYEPNDGCGEVAALPSVKTDGTSEERGDEATGQIYYTGDVDYYRIRVEEAGDADCLITCVDNEASRLSVELTVPAGAGSYELCVVPTTCENVNSTTDCITVTGGDSGEIEVTGRYRCCSGIGCNSDNSENFYLRVRGVGEPGWECNSYRLTYTGDETC